MYTPAAFVEERPEVVAAFLAEHIAPFYDEWNAHERSHTPKGRWIKGTRWSLLKAPAKQSVEQLAINQGVERFVDDEEVGSDSRGHQQLPGPGGSVDILDAAHAKGAFAIVPTRHDLYGSYDPYLSTV